MLYSCQVNGSVVSAGHWAHCSMGEYLGIPNARTVQEAEQI